jgi:hypothetical protein
MAIGLYTYRPFWLEEAIDPNTVWDPDFQEQTAQIEPICNDNGIAVHCRRDGLIILEVKSTEDEIAKLKTSNTLTETKVWSQYLNYANAFQLVLDSHIFKELKKPHLLLTELSVREIARIELDQAELKLKRSSFAAFSYAESLHQIYSRYQFIDPNKRPLHNPKGDPALYDRFVLPKSILLQAGQDFLEVASSSEKLNTMARLSKSVSEFKIGNFEFALISGWFILESLANRRWAAYLTSVTDGSDRFPKPRRDFLTGRDFTISVTTNVLELLRQISSDRFRTIDGLRKKRNRIVHSLGQVTLSKGELESMFRTIADMLLEEYGIRWTVNPIMRTKLF